MSSGVHQHLVVAAAQVELGEEARAQEFVKEFVDHWDRELVLHCALVQGAVVDAEAPRAVRLAQEEYRGGERRCTGPDDALLQHGVALSLQLILLELGVAVGADCDRCGARRKVYAVVAVMARRKSCRRGEHVLEGGRQVVEVSVGGAHGV